MNRLLRLERLEKVLLQPSRDEQQRLLASLGDEDLERLEALQEAGDDAGAHELWEGLMAGRSDSAAQT